MNDVPGAAGFPSVSGMSDKIRSLILIGFLMKKAFWDGWDNMGKILLMNLMMIVLLAVPVFVPRWLVSLPVLSILSLVAGVLALFVYIGGASRYARDIVYYKSPELKELPGHIRDTWKQSLFLGAGALVFYFVCFVGFRFYGQLGNMMGLVGMAFLFWVSLIVSIALLFFLPVLNHLDRDIRKILKKCFIIFFDNTGAAIFLFLAVLFNAGLSVVLAFILPGVGGILILLESTMKLLMMKYDYLEENPDADRKKVPWNALLLEEREKIGKRTLKGTIFPWKE